MVWLKPPATGIPPEIAIIYSAKDKELITAIHQMDLELRAERAAAGRASAKTTGKSGR